MSCLKSIILLFLQQGLGKVFDIKKDPEDPEAEAWVLNKFKKSYIGKSLH